MDQRRGLDRNFSKITVNRARIQYEYYFKMLYISLYE